MASTFIKIMNVEILTLVLFIQISIATSMNNGKSISIIFLPIALSILIGSMVIYIYKSVKFK